MSQTPDADTVSVRKLLDDARAFARQSQDVEARLCLDEAITVAPESGVARFARLEFSLTRGLWSDALADATHLQHLATSQQDRGMSQLAAQSAAVACRELCRWDEAARWQQRAILGEPSPADLTGMANDALVRGELRLAWKLFLGSLHCERLDRNLAGAAADYGGLGNVAALSQKWVLAEKLYKRAMRLHRHLRDEAGLTRDLLNMARVAAGKGNLVEALRRAGLAVVWSKRSRQSSLVKEARALRRELRRYQRARDSDASLN